MERGKTEKTRVSAVVTLEEHRKLHAIAKIRASSVSQELRDNSINDLLDAARRAEQLPEAA